MLRRVCQTRDCQTGNVAPVNQQGDDSPTSAADAADGFVSVTQAAALLGVGVRTFERYAAAGLLTVYRLPNSLHRRFRRAEVLALVTPDGDADTTRDAG